MCLGEAYRVERLLYRGADALIARQPCESWSSGIAGVRLLMLLART